LLKRRAERDAQTNTFAAIADEWLLTKKNSLTPATWAQVRPPRCLPTFNPRLQAASFSYGIRGMRVTVRMIVGQINAGHGVEEILDEYPFLEREDIEQALRFRERTALSLLGTV